MLASAVGRWWYTGKQVVSPVCGRESYRVLVLLALGLATISLTNGVRAECTVQWARLSLYSTIMLQRIFPSIRTTATAFAGARLLSVSAARRNVVVPPGLPEREETIYTKLIGRFSPSQLQVEDVSGVLLVIDRLGQF